MKIAVTGASGLIGSALVPHLREAGHEVLRLVRRDPRAGDEVRWDPARGDVDTSLLQGLDAAVHLAGVNIGARPWTEGHKRAVRESRINGTRTLATALTEVSPRPAVLVVGSAVGFYGDGGDRVLTESDPAGSGFEASVVLDWEAAAQPAADAGIRVVAARSAVVASRRGGAFGRLLPLFRVGLGGRLGTGRQWWSLVSLPDEARALRFLVEHDELSGPVNVCGVTATNADLTAALARALHRPALAPVPVAAIRVLLGEMSEMVLLSRRADSRRLRAAGFAFEHDTVDALAGYVAGG